MAFTFKDAFDEIDEKAFYLEEDETWANVSSSVVYLITDLQETYAPTIKMHKIGKEQLLWFLENSNFERFLENVGETQKLYTELSIEDLMQAWLHPENIEIVG